MSEGGVRRFGVIAAIAAVLLAAGALWGQEQQAKEEKTGGTVSFKDDVMPIIQMGFVPVPIDCEPLRRSSVWPFLSSNGRIFFRSSSIVCRG